MSRRNQQLAFDFSKDPNPGKSSPAHSDRRDHAPDAVDRWREERRTQLEALARDLGLPLGHDVEVTLHTGPVLTGKLTLAHEQLWIEPSSAPNGVRLSIGPAEFTNKEIETCVRQD